MRDFNQVIEKYRAIVEYNDLAFGDLEDRLSAVSETESMGRSESSTVWGVGSATKNTKN